jgi:hypothetical protein
MSEVKEPATAIEVLLDTDEAAHVLKAFLGTLRNWRSLGKGLAYVVLGDRVVRYSPRALLEYIETRTRHAVRRKRRLLDRKRGVNPLPSDAA